MISEEDLTQDPSCCLSDNCSTTYYQNTAVKLPEIVISNATGCSGASGGVALRSGGGSDGAASTTATSAPSLCYVKLNSSPLIRRHNRRPLVAISSRPTGGSSGHPTADTTTTSDSLDLFSSTEYDNASRTNSTLLLVNNDEMTKCFDQSSPEEDESSHDMPVLQESASLTSLVLQNSSRPIATNSVNNFVSKGFQSPYGLQIHDNQEEEAADNRSDKTRNMERETRNSLVEIRSGAAGLHLSAQVSTTAADGDAADLAASDQSRGESAINEHKSIKYSAAKDNPIKQMTADDHCWVKPETDSGLSSSGDNLAREVNKKFNRPQMDEHHQLASSYEAPDSVELSRSSDIALDARRTCLKTMAATTTTAVDDYTGSSEVTSNKHKINHVNDVSKNRAYRAKLTKRRHRAQTRNKIIVSQEKRAAKTLGIIMGCFVVCWLPFFIVAVLRPFYAVPPVVTEIITWLGYFNSLINPGIYTFFNQDFRRAFYKIVTLRMCRQDSLYI